MSWSESHVIHLGLKLAYGGTFAGKVAKFWNFESCQILAIDSSKEPPLDADSKYRNHLVF